jgi:hypothetical protein
MKAITLWQPWATLVAIGVKPFETTDRREAEALEAKWKLESYRSRQWEEDPEVHFEGLVTDRSS